MKKMKNVDDEKENKWILKFTRGFQRQIQTGIRNNQKVEDSLFEVVQFEKQKRKKNQ